MKRHGLRTADRDSLSAAGRGCVQAASCAAAATLVLSWYYFNLTSHCKPPALTSASPKHLVEPPSCARAQAFSRASRLLACSPSLSKSPFRSCTSGLPPSLSRSPILVCVISHLQQCARHPAREFHYI
jgi:hypothetical protein